MHRLVKRFGLIQVRDMPRRVELHPYCGFLGAVHLHLRHAFDLAQSLAGRDLQIESLMQTGIAQAAFELFPVAAVQIFNDENATVCECGKVASE